jgi:hypothetical protein
MSSGLVNAVDIQNLNESEVSVFVAVSVCAIFNKCQKIILNKVSLEKSSFHQVPEREYKQRMRLLLLLIGITFAFYDTVH